MKTENVLWLIFGGMFLGYTALTYYVHALSRAGNHRKAAFICGVAGGLGIVPAALWFCFGAYGYYAFTQNGGRWDMIGFFGVLGFAALFSQPIFWAGYLLMRGYKLRRKSLASQKLK